MDHTPKTATTTVLKSWDIVNLSVFLFLFCFFLGGGGNFRRRWRLADQDRITLEDSQNHVKSNMPICQVSGYVHYNIGIEPEVSELNCYQFIHERKIT